MHATLASADTTSAPEKESRNKLARRHFQRALDEVHEQNFELAISEFRAAYEARPHFTVYYNLAQAHLALGQPVEAERAFEHYLQEGKTEVPPSRRSEVERVLGSLHKRIGWLELVGVVEEAKLSVDGVDIGGAERSAPLPLAVGRHVVVVQRSGSEPQVQVIEISSQQPTRFSLPEAPAKIPIERGILRTHCEVPDVYVEVDAQPLGLSNSASALLPGTHSVKFVRTGYEFDVVSAAVNSERELEVNCTRRPHQLTGSERSWFHIAASPSDARLTIDGERFADGFFPIGLHQVEVTRTGYLPSTQMVRLTAGEPRELSVRLSLSPQSRRALDELKTERRAWAWGLGVTSVALLGGGMAALAWNQQRYQTWRRDRDNVELDIANGKLEGNSRRPLYGRVAGLQAVDDVAAAALFLSFVSGTLAISSWWRASAVSDHLAASRDGLAFWTVW